MRSLLRSILNIAVYASIAFIIVMFFIDLHHALIGGHWLNIGLSIFLFVFIVYRMLRQLERS